VGRSRGVREVLKLEVGVVHARIDLAGPVEELVALPDELHAVLHTGLLDPQPVEQALVAAPLGAGADVEVQEDLGAELALELGSGGGADLLDLRSA
jgi:hypothetical protein